MSELDIRLVSGGPLNVNTYVVGTHNSDCCILIDPGAEEELIRSAVGERKVKYVLLTHAHFDHMLFAKPWLEKGAKLYVHELDAPALRNPALNLSQVINASLVLQDADTFVCDEDVLCLCGINLTVLHTPGHTPGCVCYLTKDNLFSGDTLFYQTCGRTDLPGGDAQEMMESLHRLMTLPPETVVYPGHGMKTKIAWERRNFA